MCLEIKFTLLVYASSSSGNVAAEIMSRSFRLHLCFTSSDKSIFLCLRIRFFIDSVIT